MYIGNECSDQSINEVSIIHKYVISHIEVVNGLLKIINAGGMTIYDAVTGELIRSNVNRERLFHVFNLPLSCRELLHAYNPIAYPCENVNTVYFNYEYARKCINEDISSLDYFKLAYGFNHLTISVNKLEIFDHVDLIPPDVFINYVDILCECDIINLTETQEEIVKSNRDKIHCAIINQRFKKARY